MRDSLCPEAAGGLPVRHSPCRRTSWEESPTHLRTEVSVLGFRGWSAPSGWWQPTVGQLLGSQVIWGGEMKQATFQIKIAFPPGCHS